MDFLLLPENWSFAVAAAAIVLFAFVEVAGLLVGFSSLGIGHAHGPDIGHDIGHDVAADASMGPVAAVLSWIGIGKVPLIVVLIAFAGLFSSVGYAIQGIAVSHFSLLPGWLASTVATLAALPLTRIVASGIVRLIPREESYGDSFASLVGRPAVITEGTARPGLPAPARAKGRHGTLYVNVVPRDGAAPIAEGTEVCLVERKSDSNVEVFVAVPTGAAPQSN